MSVALQPARAPAEIEAGAPLRRGGTQPSRRWALAGLAAVAVSAVAAGLGHDDVANPAGWPMLRDFLAAAVRPALGARFLALVWDATLTTVSYAVLGTALSTALGLVGGVLLCESWWRRGGRARSAPARPWYAVRAALAVPRGVHEAVWGLFLVGVLGLDPLVAVLAIGVPYGAVTAKVVADLLDEAAGAPYSALRAAGAGPTVALAYAALPVAAPDVVSYVFYRLECAVRAAAILGIIGAGGLGFQLALSFQSLRYGEIWTLVYALVALSALADAWSARVRRSRTPAALRLSLAVAAVLLVVSWVHVGVDVTTLWSARARDLAAGTLSSAWPPRLGPGGLTALLRLSLETLQLSLLGVAGAVALAVPAAFLAARPARPALRPVAVAVRVALLVARAVPPPVWALVLLFVLFPGPLPGAAALALYNFGVLGRLMAEVAENLDRRPRDSLRAAGASRAAAFAYAVVPQALPRFAAYALYRWEVAVRETVVVGLVGAGGLGRRLAQQFAAFDHAGVTATLLALVVLTLLVDVASAAVRRSLR